MHFQTSKINRIFVTKISFIWCTSRSVEDNVYLSRDFTVFLLMHSISVDDRHWKYFFPRPFFHMHSANVQSKDDVEIQIVYSISHWKVNRPQTRIIRVPLCMQRLQRKKNSERQHNCTPSSSAWTRPLSTVSATGECHWNFALVFLNFFVQAVENWKAISWVDF